MKGNSLMTQHYRLGLFLSFFLAASTLHAQESPFMQYLADPLNISPALAARAGTDFRALANARSQWLGKSSMYHTQQITLDGKIGTQSERNYFGLGGMFLADKALEGLYKSNQLSLNGSYHFALNEYGSGLALGIGVIGNNTRVDFSQLTFDQQLGSSGFDLSLPSGESSMRNSTFQATASAGILYTFESDNLYLDAGVSGYRFVTFVKSFYNDPRQIVYPRYSAHAFLSATLTDRLTVQASAMNMLVNKRNLIYASAALGILLSENNPYMTQMLFLGSYLRGSGVVAPYVGYTYGNLDIGLSSDVNLSAASSGSVVNRALEITLAYNVASYNSRRR